MRRQSSTSEHLITAGGEGILEQCRPVARPIQPAPFRAHGAQEPPRRQLLPRLPNRERVHYDKSSACCILRLEYPENSRALDRLAGGIAKNENHPGQSARL